MKALTYYKAKNVEDAYQTLLSNERNVVLGGGVWLKRSESEYNTLIDLSLCGLDSITETEDEYVVGSMATLREVEVSKLGKEHLGGVLGDALNQIMGVPLRNLATIGGTIMGRFPFSDAITPLVVMDATLEMYPDRMISIQDFLKEKKMPKQILKAIHIKKQSGRALFKKAKLTDLGFAIVNLCVGKVDGKYMISVGARPLVGTLALKAMELLNSNPITDELIAEAAKTATEELMFLDTSGNSKDYRKTLVEVYIRRFLKEIK